MLTYEEYIKQNKSFCDALEQLKQEVAQKRSELAKLAKQTVDQLEAQIPKLQAQVNTLNAEVLRLDGLIRTKDQQSQYDESYWKNYYTSLQSTLEKEHQARMAKLDIVSEGQDNRDNDYRDDIAGLHAREEKLKESQDKFKSDVGTLEILRQDFEKERSSHSEKINKIMSDLNGHINEVNAEKLKQKEITERLEKQSQELADATNKAMATIDRINEVQKILDAATEKENNVIKIQEQTKLMEAELDEKNAVVIAEAVRNRNKSQDLDHRELSLNQRESNLKIALAELRKGS